MLAGEAASSCTEESSSTLTAALDIHSVQDTVPKNRSPACQVFFVPDWTETV